MLNEELNDQILQTKLTYLNGYLNALEMLNSTNGICMKYKLFVYNFSAGDIAYAIQSNAYELFGVYPNDWELEINKCTHWKEKLQSQLYFDRESQNPDTTSSNDLISNLNSRIKETISFFIHLIEKEFAKKANAIYELKITKSDALYRLIGIDLIFEIEDTKMIVLQIQGMD